MTSVIKVAVIKHCRPISDVFFDLDDDDYDASVREMQERAQVVQF